MKRKIALILATIICQSAISAHAQIDEPIYDIFSGKVKITGKTLSEKEARPVSVKILNPDQTLQYASTGSSGANGVYEFNLKLHMDTVNDYGEYKVSVSGYDYTTAEEETIYVADDTEISTIVGNLNTIPETELVNYILGYAEKLHLNFDLFTQVDTTELVRIIRQESVLRPFSSSDLTDVHKRLKKCAIVTAYNKGNQVLITSGTTILYDDILELDNIDQYGVTLYSVYKTKLSDAGKTSINSAMSNRNFNTSADWEKEFLTQIVLKTIESPSVGGVTYVSDVITAENAAKVGLNATQYLSLADKSTVNSQVARQTYTTLTALSTALIPPVDIGGGDSGGYSPGGGGGMFVNSSSFINPDTIASPEEMDVKMFGDIPENYWLYKELYRLRELNIISGDNNNMFNPDAPVKREEFAKMLCNVFSLTAKSSDITFIDVMDGAWYEQYVNTVASNGVVNGYEDGSFGVGRNITRQDLCVMVYRALKGAEQDVSKPVFEFHDGDSIADYAKDAVDYMYVENIISGFDDHTFKPQNECTRAHAAKIIYSVLDKINQTATEE